MKNKLKYFSLLLVVIFCAAFTVEKPDVGTGFYLFKGQIYFGNKLLTNDSVKVVYHFANKPVSNADIKYLNTDLNGNYLLQVNWSTPCPSSHFTDCKNLSKDDCLHFHASEMNADTIGFVYKNSEVKIFNIYWELSKSPSSGVLYIQQDIRF